MTQIPVTIVDAADVRSFECLLPESVPVGRLAMRLAESLHLPLLSWDGGPLAYGLIVVGGPLLDPDATLGQLRLPSPVAARLVPDICAGADVPERGNSSEQAPSRALGVAREPGDDGDEEPDIRVGEGKLLIQDAWPSGTPDVQIDVEVLKEIEAFAAENRNRECAGLLLGDVNAEGRRGVVHITAAAMARDAAGTRASVNISLSAWESMLRVRDHEHPGLRILGWFHTHAGWGVFMSDSDVFIHRHFFGHPSMVAYVLDPTTGRDGFFYWHDGKIGLCPSYGLVGTAEELAPRSQAASSGAGRIKRFVRVLSAALGALLLIAGIGYLGKPLVSRISREKPAAKIRPVVSTTEQSAVVDQIYTVKPGDNAWRICNREYGDGDLAMALMAYNGLANVSGLQIGQKIKLPSEETLRKLAERQ